ncbi:hypothetical protein G9464_10305 [Halostella sp. JP-L12]|uniref:DUF7342 family protein n=1 Tax=Halostella TaxID=1843185 RepID=UPI000EF7A1FC|nr:MULTISPECIES: hypothetical protein [Halostella]NHN47987.1 hypothetical protein [Halostella sp. JP-L12]
MDLTDVPDDVRDVSEDPPDFDELNAPEDELKGGPTRERLLDVVVQLREPTKVSTIAESANCDTETARDYLEWFAAMGIVHEYSGRPVRYERNQSYLRWRRVERLRDAYSATEIVEKLTETVEALKEYQARFAAESPDAVSLVNASRETPVEEVWEALSEWKTLEQRAELLDAARRDEDVPGGRDGRADA